VIEKPVFVYLSPPTPAPDVSASTPAIDATTSQALADYRRLQEQVLLHGLDGLPQEPPVPATHTDDLDKMFGVPGLIWPRPPRSGT
jgi:hypothetical protein